LARVIRDEMKINEIYNENCLETMARMPDNFVDLVVTSPPYDNLRTYNGSLDWGEHVWKPVIQELFRIVKEGGVVVWVVGDATIKGSETGTSFKQALYFKECGFNLHDTMIWEKDTFSFPSVVRYRSCFEYMFVFSKGMPKLNAIEDRKNAWAGHKVHGTSRQIDGTTKRKSNTGTITKEWGVRFNVWHQSTVKTNRGGHPATFPEQLAHDHIISWSNEGDTILDPFAGSGTVGKMAKQLNRNFILIEKEPEYVEIIKRRLELSTPPLK
jgi:site-specific DNA-methyltransferase (adenine-specific)